MPRYYFNVRCDRFEATDTVGEYCRNLLEARFEAMRTAREIVRKQLLADDGPQRGWIEVEDEDHQAVIRLPLRSAAY